ncbi:MAG TPA: MFS transporter [Anaerolineales bacterium]|nr:MFS transporter [Anaerolineales bacterium]
MSAITQTREGKTNSFGAVLGNRNFRLLWIGEGVSVLGDHFYMIALPWLVLQLTGDSLAMGTVLALSAIPRALLMLVGGALTDRFSPRGLMLVSNAARFILVSILTGLVFTGRVEMWMIYTLAIAFGVADAFFYPAQSSMPPQLVRKDHLQAANSLVQGTMMLSMLIGPALAGVLIAALGDGHSTGANMQGIAAAFGLDALTFLASLITLLILQTPQNESAQASENIITSIRSGLNFVWNDLPLRAFFFVVAAITFFFNGPFNIGIPLLADTRFPEGAVAYGTILSTWGAGSLVGMVLAGMLPRPNPKRTGTVLLALVSVMGIGLAFLGVAASMIFASAIGLVLGSVDGYINVFFITWVQSRAPKALIGRLMSLLMFSSIGLLPVSMALSGAASRVDVTLLLTVSGGIVALLGILMTLNPTVRAMEPAPAVTVVE